MSNSRTDCPQSPSHIALRRMAAAIALDDLNTAIDLGLLEYIAIGDHYGIDTAAVCAQCSSDDPIIVAARDERRRALAARERFRAREARLQARARNRAEKRANAQRLGSETGNAAATVAASALPTEAAAALARAKAKAAKHGSKA